jgi:hypothetical protein
MAGEESKWSRRRTQANNLEWNSRFLKPFFLQRKFISEGTAFDKFVG